MTTSKLATGPHGWYRPEDCRLDDFRAVVEHTTDPADYPYADSVEQGVLVYGSRLRERAAAPEQRREVQAELARALLDGPGIVVFSGAFPDPSVLDRASAVFTELIAEQKASGAAAGDHFATPGANDRVWGALDKLALRAPEVFVDYYANDVLALVSEAWLGPGYQVTSQVNVVNPGGLAQVAHRDYHLGFMSLDRSLAYPAHVHRLSPVMTLQGAVAHCDMPVETGPTMYLPHSQKYAAGYVAFHRPEFTGYFDRHHVQLPLAKGDAAFFNPALFHGVAMSDALYPVLARRKAGGAGERELRNVVAASAEGYAFPTNLDRDQPVGGLAPQTQAELVWQALQEGWDTTTLAAGLRAHTDRRRTSRV